MKILSWKFGVAFSTFGIGVLMASLWSLAKPQKIESHESNNSFQLQVETAPLQNPVVVQKRDRFWVAGADTEEVEQFWATFQKAVADDDRDKVVSMATYPLRVNFYSDPLEKNYTFIKTRAAFLKQYDKVFDDALKSLIANTSVDDVWANYRGIAMPQGTIWMDVYCLDKSGDCNDEIKLRTIHANTVSIDRPKQAKKVASRYSTERHNKAFDQRRIGRLSSASPLNLSVMPLGLEGIA